MLPENYRAIVIGSSGGIGSAFVTAMNTDTRCAELFEFSRKTNPGLDLKDEASIANAADSVVGECHLIIDATGFLSNATVLPEKSLKGITLEGLNENFQINTIGPALLMKHFLPKLAKNQPSIFATLSARVGSIDDNRLGGWYSYRASKAALNMLVKSASIEIARTKQQAVVCAVHPGTVETSLSDPFASDRPRFTPMESVTQILRAISKLSPGDSGCFIDYTGSKIPW